MSLPLPELVLFDLDGTLVDSVPDIARAVDRACVDAGYPARGVDRVRGWMGNGAVMLIRRALRDILREDPAQAAFERVYQGFLAHYADCTHELTELYPGVREALQFLTERSCSIGCITNKDERFTHPLLASLGLEFDIVLCGDSLPEKKPSPLPLLHAARHFGIEPTAGLMVGDTHNDVEAARAAGYRVVGVSYGYNHGRPIHDERPDAVIDSLHELPALFASRGGGAS